MRGAQMLPAFGKPRSAPSSQAESLEMASTSGKVILNNRGLTQFPLGVFHVGEGKNHWEVEAVRTLDVSFNPGLRTLPPEICTLAESLTTLNLRGCGLSTLPSELGICIALKSLDVSQNILGALPESILTLPDLVSLNASENQLTHLPGGWGGLSNLELLYLQGNALVSLPDDLGNAARLLELNVSNNRLKQGHLPHSLSRCSRLATLNASNNGLVEVIPGCGCQSLISLQTLDVRNNALSFVPDLPSPTAPSLAVLLLGGNPFTWSDPLCAQRLSRAVNVNTLDISQTSISALPESLRACTLLSSINLCNNDLNSLPSWLGWYPCLKGVALEGNPLRTIKRSVVEGSTVALVGFLKTRASPSEAAEYDHWASSALWLQTNGREGGVGGKEGMASALRQAQQLGYKTGGIEQPNVQHPGNTYPSFAAPSKTALEVSHAEALALFWVDALREATLTGKLTVNSAALPPGVPPMASLSLEYLQGNLSSLAFVGHERDAGLKCIPARVSAAASSASNITGRVKSIVLEGHSAMGAGHDRPGLDASTCLPLELLSSCVSLEEFAMPRCSLPAIPRALCVPYNSALKALSLPGNVLTCSALRGASPHFPRGLRFLDLRHNELDASIDWISTLPCSLETLLLGKNPLGKVGVGGGMSETWDDAFLLPSLQTLDLSMCCLPRLPSSIVGLPTLTSLDLSENELKEIPPALGELPLLRDLRIGGNPQRGLRQTVIERGTPVVLEYLRGRILDGKQGEYLTLVSSKLRANEVKMETGNHPPLPTSTLPSKLLASTNIPALSMNAGREPMDPSSGLSLAEIVKRRKGVEVLLEESGVGLASAKLVVLRRDLAVLRAAESRTRLMFGL